MTRGPRVQAARALWHAHPARPGPERARLERSQWWSAEQLHDLQEKQLARIVGLASEAPFYRERFARAGIEAGSVTGLDDLESLPILERSDLEEQGIEGMRRPGSRGMRASTSGSLGRPVQILWPLAQMRWLDAGEARARGWFGSEVGERRLEVRCRPVPKPQKVVAELLNVKALHAFTVADPTVADDLVRELKRRPPTLVWGVSNALYAVALALLENGHTTPVRAVWSGGNTLHDHYRDAIEQAFDCTAYERYATIETGVIAHECPEGRSLHVPAEGLIVEILDSQGRPTPPGEVGDVVVTSLRNDATPLIRYRVGDRAIAGSAATCACGRGLPVFGGVVGRSTDLLETASGELLGARGVAAALRPGLGGVIDFQVIQDSEGGAELHVVPRATLASEERARLRSLLQELIGGGRPASVVEVAELPVTPGGKIRTVVRSAGASS